MTPSHKEKLKKEFERVQHKYICNCSEKKCPRVDIISDWVIASIESGEKELMEKVVESINRIQKSNLVDLRLETNKIIMEEMGKLIELI